MAQPVPQVWFCRSLERSDQAWRRRLIVSTSLLSALFRHFGYPLTRYLNNTSARILTDEAETGPREPRHIDQKSEARYASETDSRRRNCQDNLIQCRSAAIDQVHS